MPDIPNETGHAEWLAAFYKRLTDGGIPPDVADDLIRCLGAAVFNGRCTIGQPAVNA